MSHNEGIAKSLTGLFYTSGADQRLHLCSGCMGELGLQENALENCGVFSKTPLARKRPGL